MLAVLFVGVTHVRDGVLTLGGLLVVMAYLGQLYGPLETVSKKVADLQGTLTLDAMFGWGDIPENPEPIAADWDKAEAQTNAEFAKALAVLSESELEEFVTLANAANAATQ